MAKRRAKVVFSPNEEDIETIMFVIENVMVGFSPERVDNYRDAYYLARTNLKNFDCNYARIDTTKKDTPRNRVVLSEEDVWKELLRNYKLIKEKWTTNTLKQQ